VKGTRTNGSAVALTRNEVNFLRENAASSAMFVLSQRYQASRCEDAFAYGRMHG